MTDPHDPDAWPEFLQLADPVSERDLPSADDPSAATLLATITMQPIDRPRRDRPHGGGHRVDRRRRRGLAVVGTAAAAAGLAVVGVVALDDGGASAAPLYAAIDRTAGLGAGHIEMSETRTLNGATAVDSTTVRFRGADEDIVARPDPARPLAGEELGPDGFVPDLLEIRTIDGLSYMRVVADEMHGDWRGATLDDPSEYVSFTDWVRAIVEGAEQLDACASDAGVTAYCLSTADSADIQLFAPDLEFTGTAAVRVEIDDATGLLSALYLDATGAELAARPGSTVSYDRFETIWRFQPLDPSWSPEVPEVVDVDVHPQAAEADECLAMGDPSEVDACLADLGLETVADSGG